MITDDDLFAFARRIFPFPRSLMGPAVERTLDMIAAQLPPTTDVQRHSVASGTRVFDWTVPPQWDFRSVRLDWRPSPDSDWTIEHLRREPWAWDGSVAVVGYSDPVDTILSKQELAPSIHTLSNMPAAVPYRTCRYGSGWGLCMPHRFWESLPEHGQYHVVIDTERRPGRLAWNEVIIPGEHGEEVLLSTYVCHPALANDNVSGMVVTMALAKWLASAPRRYTYRVLFAPETIGALCWLASQIHSEVSEGEYVCRCGHTLDEHGEKVWVYPCHSCDCASFAGLDDPQPSALRRIIAGYTINCCGDERAWSFIPSRKGNTLADRAARHTIRHVVLPWVAESDCSGRARSYREYSFADRGSDERQFCAPGVDLPIASVMRSKHGTFPEYHTSADDLSLISAKGLGDSFRCYQRIIETIEANRLYRCTTIGEPMLSTHGLYPTSGGPDDAARIARDLCAYADGETDLIAIAEATGRAVWQLAPIADQLVNAGLLHVSRKV